MKQQTKAALPLNPTFQKPEAMSANETKTLRDRRHPPYLIPIPNQNAQHNMKPTENLHRVVRLGISAVKYRVLTIKFGISNTNEELTNFACVVFNWLQLFVWLLSVTE